ncbi:MAG: alcohol dehydrogenase catalytic domain-containing protein [Hyphomicrobiales bacterium]|nr:alcohol dehydrogenase catalytic domain-containing protein [Hyphomicrobiales bacterium]
MVRVKACGVCHTDLHVMKAEVAFPTPAVLGHEISGTVEALGPGVTGLALGALVASAFIMPCGFCRFCGWGRDDLCENFFAMNRLKACSMTARRGCAVPMEPRSPCTRWPGWRNTPWSRRPMCSRCPLPCPSKSRRSWVAPCSPPSEPCGMGPTCVVESASP